MKSLTILICGSDTLSLQKKAQTLTEDGVKVEISTRLVDSPCFLRQEYDFLLIDLDGLDSFLRSLLPAVSRKFPHVPIIGVSTRFGAGIAPMNLGYGLTLDDYLFEPPRTENLIVRFPHIAAKYLVDTGSLAPPGTEPLLTEN